MSANETPPPTAPVESGTPPACTLYHFKETGEIVDAFDSLDWHEGKLRKYEIVDPAIRRVVERETARLQAELADADAANDRLEGIIQGLAAECRQHKADLAALRDWQPIETAPRDGSTVIVFDSKHKDVVAAYFSEYDRSWWVLGQGEVLPTHWRPLPPAPENPSERPS